MTDEKLNELKARCAESYARGFKVEQHLGYDGSRAGTYVVQIRNDQLTQIIERAEALEQAAQKALDALESRCGTNAEERQPNGAINALKEVLKK